MGSTARGLIAGVIVLGLVAGVWWGFLRDRVSGGAENLRVGDCFLEPTGREVSNIEHRPCTESHDGEVYFVGDIDAERSEVGVWVVEHCHGAAFEAYVGDPPVERSDLDYGWFSPTFAGWERGDRQIICYLTSADGNPVSISYKTVAVPAAS